MDSAQVKLAIHSQSALFLLQEAPDPRYLKTFMAMYCKFPSKSNFLPLPLFISLSDLAVTPFGLVDPPVEGYRGSIPENLPAGSTVQLSGGSAIRTDRDSELLCRVDVVRHHGEIRVPFEVVLTDQAGGLAELRTTERLDYEGQNFYSFQIEAISCSGTYAERSERRGIEDTINCLSGFESRINN